MDVKEVKEDVKNTLQEFYEEYRSSGIASIYLQGSILFPEDFEPGQSDIDSVAIVDDDVSIEEEEAIRDYLSEQSSHELGIRLVHRADLNKGLKISNLAQFVDTKLLLYAMPHWEHVSGFDFDPESFELAPVTHDEVIEIHLRTIYDPDFRETEEDWRHAERVGPDGFKYYLNNLGRLIHAVQAKRDGERRPFSYSKLLERAENDQERAVVQALLKVRDSRDFQDFQQHTDCFQQYVEAVAPDDVLRSIEQDVKSRRTVENS